MFRLKMKASQAALWTALAITPLMGLVGCDDNDGPMEEAGEAIDDAADEIEDAVDKD
jgi:hypothetical protein